MKAIYIISFLFLLFSCKQAPDQNIQQQVAIANGVERFKDAEMIEFTFNVQRDTAAASSRHWQWFPKTNDAVFITDSGTTRFSRTDTSTAELKKLNARFTNDEYWLLFPLHLGWDQGMQVLDSGMKAAPISSKSLRKLVVQYNNTDGFTPGNMYDLYLDEKNRIQEWAFHKTAEAEAGLITTWEDYKEFNGLHIAQEHKSKDGKFRLWFTNIMVK